MKRVADTCLSVPLGHPVVADGPSPGLTRTYFDRFFPSFCSSLLSFLLCLFSFRHSRTTRSSGDGPAAGLSKLPMLLLGHDSRRSQVKEVTPAWSEIHHGHKSHSPGSPAPPPTSTADCPPLDLYTLWLTCLGILFFFFFSFFLPGCPNLS